MLLRVLVRSILCFGLLSFSLFAQTALDQSRPFSAGSLTGSVRGVNEQPISNARVELRDIGTASNSSSTYTRENGVFEMYNIKPGEYEVVVTSGTAETHERVTVTSAEASVSMRLNVAGAAPDGSATVSVAKMKVPEKAQKEFQKANDAFRSNKLEEALKHADKALSIYPNYAEALVLRGILAISDKKVADGENYLQQAIKADPSYGMAYIAMGAALNQDQKYADAERALERGITLSPDSWQAYFEMSKAALGLQKYADAVKDADRAAALAKEDYPPVHLVKAHALMGLQRYDVAVAELEQFLSRDPQNPNADYARETLGRAKAFVATGSK